MSRLSDVLGGVYRDDDPTPDQHDSAALDVAPDVDEETEAAAVWELDDDEATVAPSDQAVDDEAISAASDPGIDDEPKTAPSDPAIDDEPTSAQSDAAIDDEPTTAPSDPAIDDDPVETAPVWDLQSVVDDPTSDWETAVVGEPVSEWDEPATVDADPGLTPVASSWLDDLADAGQADDAPAWDLDAAIEAEDARFETAPQPGAIVEPEPGDAAEADDDRVERSITAASFGLLSAEEAPEDDLDITDGGPWLRTDDDILPAKAKRSLAFWRR